MGSKFSHHEVHMYLAMNTIKFNETSSSINITYLSNSLSIVDCSRVPLWGAGGLAIFPQLNANVLPTATRLRRGVKKNNETVQIISIMSCSSPTFSFSIPSVHDGCKLECRLYLPGWLRNIESAPAWSTRGAIVAHPYAPLGGCFDDPVIGFVGGELLQAGYVVGTFNFRYSSSMIQSGATKPVNMIFLAEPVTLKDGPAGLEKPNWETMSRSTGSCCGICIG